MTVDPLTLAVVSGGVVAIAEEMGWALRRTSFSEAVREGEDCSASVFDANGRMIGAGNYAPGHLGTSPTAVAGVLEVYPSEEMRPGDAFLVNDPTMNSGHFPDIFSIAPVFYYDEVVGFTVVTAHHVDVGGAAPGSQAIIGIVDIHQEGIRILPTKYFSEGKPIREVLDLIAANVRIPDQVVGDLRGQYNANMVGATKICELIDRFGLDTYRAATTELLERSGDAMRQHIAAVPAGRYEFVDHIDDFGPDTEPIRLQLAVIVGDGKITADYSGSSPVTRSGVNSYLAFTTAYTFHAILSVVGPRLPLNSGTMQPVEVSAPAHSFFNARYPTPTGGRAIVARYLVDAVQGALAQAVPEQVTAASSQLANSTIGGVDVEAERPWVYYDLTFGSTGARPNKDGCDGLVSGFNTGNIPIEIHEAKWPVLIDRFGFIPDSAGPGTYRGGLAVRRDVRNLADLARVTNLHDRHVYEPWGLFGGGAGSLGRIVLNPDRSDEADLHSKSILDVGPNDVISFRTCGCGGYGDPFQRDPDAVLDDVLEGWVTVAGARRDYGVVIEDGKVNEAATAALRGTQ
jgi:N-methylhydantoinase B